MTADTAIGTKGIQRAGGIVDVVRVVYLFCRNVCRGSGAAPVIAAVAFLDLEFMRPHPGTEVGAVGAGGMIEQAAVLFLIFLLSPGAGAPFAQDLEMVVAVFARADDAAHVFAGDTNDLLPILWYYGKDAVRVMVETNGLLAGPAALAIRFGRQPAIPTREVLAVEEAGPCRRVARAAKGGAGQQQQ